eukprot:scaffold120601_cov51-Attheya_sp.AAC.4
MSAVAIPFRCHFVSIAKLHMYGRGGARGFVDILSSSSANPRTFPSVFRHATSITCENPSMPDGNEDSRDSDVLSFSIWYVKKLVFFAKNPSARILPPADKSGDRRRIYENQKPSIFKLTHS